MPEWVREWWPMLAFVLTAGLGVAGWAIRTGLASRHDLDRGLREEQTARAREIDGLETRVVQQLDELRKAQSVVGERMVRIESELQHLPTTADFNELRSGIAKVEGRLLGVEQQGMATGTAVTRIENYLLRGEK